MVDIEDDAVAILCFGAGSFFVMSEDNNIDLVKKRRQKRSEWVRKWVRKRETDGCFVKLMRELKEEKAPLYDNFLRMNDEHFQELLKNVTPYIIKCDTNMRKAIPPGERLAVTLRYLATGESFASLQYIFRIPQCTISTIIPEVCSAIYNVLKKDYLKVN